jgi:2-polyprenyl-3-methyl-5-hydroxy-6-metoxy-1,4-benzoquinol methylase
MINMTVERSEQIKCPLCDSSSASTFLTTQDFRFGTTEANFHLARCIDCGLVFINPKLTIENLSHYYPEAYYLYKPNLIGEFIHRLACDAKFRMIKRYKRKGRVLDLGCGRGDLLLRFEKEGWETFGLDISKTLSELLSKKLKNVFNCQLSHCNFQSGYFDVVILNHVLEHLVTPSQELEEIHRILKHDGIVYICSPNIDSVQFKIGWEKWFHLDVPRHAYHFQRKSLTNILEKNGFAIVKFGYPMLDFPQDLFRTLSEKYCKQKIGLVGRLLVYPIVLMISIFLVAGFAKMRGTMEVIAVKQRDFKKDKSEQV